MRFQASFMNVDVITNDECYTTSQYCRKIFILRTLYLILYIVQELMPDSLHWLGITKIDNLISMSDMKYNAIVGSGIKVKPLINCRSQDV